MSIIETDWGTHVLKYNRGNVEFFEIDDGGVQNLLWEETWSSDWTHLVAFIWDDKPYLLCYKSFDGTTTINQITDDGYLDGHELKWRPGWENMVVYYEGTEPRLLSRRPGEAVVDAITGSSVTKIQHV